MAQNILRKFQPTMRLLDQTIHQLEVQLGKNHTTSPFTQLNQKYNFSTVNGNKEEDKQQQVPSTTQAQSASNEETKQVPQQQQQKQAKPQQEKKPQQQKGGNNKNQPKVEEVKLDEVWEVYSKCDLRVGRVVECEPHPESQTIYREKVDLGEGELRDIGSGLNGKIPVEEMKKGLVIVFANLKPRKLVDIMSNGMILCASASDKSVVELIRPPEGSKIGERVQLAGNPILGKELRQEKEDVLNPKKKYAERLLDNLKTNDSLEATYNGISLTTSAGVIIAQTLKGEHIA